jgi:hypothetical protein
VIHGYGKPQWNDVSKRKPKKSQRNLTQCHIVRHKSKMDWPDREPMSNYAVGFHLSVWNWWSLCSVLNYFALNVTFWCKAEGSLLSPDCTPCFWKASEVSMNIHSNFTVHRMEYYKNMKCKKITLLNFVFTIIQVIAMWGGRDSIRIREPRLLN